MLVLYQKKLYSLDMRYSVFSNLRDGIPNMEVELWGVTTSNFKEEPIKVKIGECNECNVSKTT